MITAGDIQSTRSKLGESQAAFGARFGIDQSTVHRWEISGPPKQKLVQDGIKRVLHELRPDIYGPAPSTHPEEAGR